MWTGSTCSPRTRATDRGSRKARAAAATPFCKTSPWSRALWICSHRKGRRGHEAGTMRCTSSSLPGRRGRERRRTTTTTRGTAWPTAGSSGCSGRRRWRSTADGLSSSSCVSNAMTAAMPLRGAAAEHLRCQTCQLCSNLVAMACQHCIVADVMSCQHSLSDGRGYVQARSCRSCRRSGNRSPRSRRRATCCSCRRDGRMRFSTCARGLGWRRSSSSRTGSDESERRNQYHALGLAPFWRHTPCKQKLAC